MVVNFVSAAVRLGALLGCSATAASAFAAAASAFAAATVAANVATAARPTAAIARWKVGGSSGIRCWVSRRSRQLQQTEADAFLAACRSLIGSDSTVVVTEINTYAFHVAVTWNRHWLSACPTSSPLCPHRILPLPLLCPKD